jgi:hypothetical protein
MEASYANTEIPGSEYRGGARQTFTVTQGVSHEQGFGQEAGSEEEARKIFPGEARRKKGEKGEEAGPGISGTLSTAQEQRQCQGREKTLTAI